MNLSGKRVLASVVATVALGIAPLSVLAHSDTQNGGVGNDNMDGHANFDNMNGGPGCDGVNGQGSGDYPEVAPMRATPSAGVKAQTMQS